MQFYKTMETNGHRVSVIVLAKNEEPRIKQCLEKLQWARECIVVDNGSTDETVSIAKQFGAKIINSEEKDFSNLRMLGCQAAKSPWILYIDADEQVTSALEKEIVATIDHFD